VAATCGAGAGVVGPAAKGDVVALVVATVVGAGCTGVAWRGAVFVFSCGCAVGRGGWVACGEVGGACGGVTFGQACTVTAGGPLGAGCTSIRTDVPTGSGVESLSVSTWWATATWAKPDGRLAGGGRTLPVTGSPAC